ncbi:hypothetical protein FRC03_009503 [Tulasnella sp. 419]|nr:hypothetical protein FRC03_009503 [Tulasnella sp. 419]
MAQNYHHHFTTTAGVQTLLLLGYWELGMGAMSMAWTCVGLAIRMAQDLGLHRNIDKWDGDFVRKQFGNAERYEEEKMVRGRVWHSCCRMDLLLSAYNGRPITIHEREYDTPYPEGDEEEDTELWQEHPSAPPGGGEPINPNTVYTPQPIRATACNRAAHSLGRIGSAVLDGLYSIKPKSLAVRHLLRDRLSRKLDKWYNDLDDCLRFDNPSARTYIRTPATVDLHMQYWATVLLLHRPFIKLKEGKGAPIIASSSPGTTSESQQRRSAHPLRDDTAVSAKAYSACLAAAQHITALAAAFSDSFNMNRAPIPLSYAVFSAAIMHVTGLLDNPQDVQAQLGLQKTMLFLKNMSVVWPSAGRAWELLNASNFDVRQGVELERLTNALAIKRERKRATVDDLDVERVQQMTGRGDWSPTTSISGPASRGYFNSQISSSIPGSEHSRRRSAAAGSIHMQHVQHQRISPPLIVPSQSTTAYQGLMGSGGRLIDSASPVHETTSGLGRGSSNAPATGSSRDADASLFGTSSRPQWPSSHNLPPLDTSTAMSSSSLSLHSGHYQQQQQLPPLLMPQDHSPHSQHPAPLSPLSQILQQASPQPLSGTSNFGALGSSVFGHGQASTPPISAVSQGSASRYGGGQFHPDALREQSTNAPTPMRQHTLDGSYDAQSSRYSEAPSSDSGGAWNEYPHPPAAQQPSADSQYGTSVPAGFGSSSTPDMGHMLPPMSAPPLSGYHQQHSSSGGFDQQYNQYRGGTGSFFGGEPFTMRMNVDVVAGG